MTAWEDLLGPFFFVVILLLVVAAISECAESVIEKFFDE